jgi:ribosomal protein L15E
VYSQIGYADENFRFCGDWLTWIKFSLISDIAYIDKVLNYFRYHDQTTRKSSVYASRLKVKENYYCMLYAKKEIKTVSPFLEIGLTEAFYYWHNNSLYRFFKGFNWENYTAAKKIDPRINRRILHFIKNKLIFGLKSIVKKKIGLSH